MKYDKIMAGGNLEDIVVRLKGAIALLNALYENAGGTETSEDALRGLRDLLECICRDFQADIDSTEDYKEETRA